MAAIDQGWGEGGAFVGSSNTGALPKCANKRLETARTPTFAGSNVKGVGGAADGLCHSSVRHLVCQPLGRARVHCLHPAHHGERSGVEALGSELTSCSKHKYILSW